MVPRLSNVDGAAYCPIRSAIPLSDSPALVRAALQLLGVEASRRVATTTGSDIGVADSKILTARQPPSELVTFTSS
jgi:hypothetical protein